MPFAARVGDKINASGGTIVGNLAPTVIINNIPAVVVGAEILTHNNGVAAVGQATVGANGYISGVAVIYSGTGYMSYPGMEIAGGGIPPAYELSMTPLVGGGWMLSGVTILEDPEDPTKGSGYPPNSTQVVAFPGQTKGTTTHPNSYVSAGSSTVTMQGLAAGRKDDIVSCGHKIDTCSADVIIG